MSTIKEKLKDLAAKETSPWSEKAQWRTDNAGWLEKSAIVAIQVLRTIRRMNLSQKDLAEKLNVSPQQVNKLLKGQENFTLETIDKLEKALNITISFTGTPDFQSVSEFKPKENTSNTGYTKKQKLSGNKSDYKKLQESETVQGTGCPIFDLVAA